MINGVCCSLRTVCALLRTACVFVTVKARVERSNHIWSERLHLIDKNLMVPSASSIS